jgi:hypothetical protein
LAEVAILVVTAVIDLVAGALLGPTEGALWLPTISGICIIAVPMVANTALGVSMWRAGRFRWLHGLAPSAATVLGGVVVFSSVFPLPAAPIGSAVLVALAWLLVGLGVTSWYARRHPDRLRLGLSRG